MFGMGLAITLYICTTEVYIDMVSAESMNVPTSTGYIYSGNEPDGNWPVWLP